MVKQNVYFRSAGVMRITHPDPDALRNGFSYNGMTFMPDEHGEIEVPIEAHADSGFFSHGFEVAAPREASEAKAEQAETAPAAKGKAARSREASAVEEPSA